MKTLALISGIVAAILIIFAIIMWLFVSAGNQFLGVGKAVTFIHSANAALLFTIVFKMCEKEE
ncbi:MAG: hypothetical protein KGY75_04920 [Candidatus Cloacimonetes bacterium]|nr:hypothetical protein [Candidatus Cloacimonadota bacterium]MBS3767442.1 hypothetical protein [Candidatus Cloacimonadota bacterium]